MYTVCSQAPSPFDRFLKKAKSNVKMQRAAVKDLEKRKVNAQLAKEEVGASRMVTKYS